MYFVPRLVNSVPFRLFVSSTSEKKKELVENKWRWGGQFQVWNLNTVDMI